MLKYDFIFHPPLQIKPMFILFRVSYTENTDFKNCFYMFTNGHVGFEFLAAWNQQNLKFKVNLALLLREILFNLCTITVHKLSYLFLGGKNSKQVRED